MTIRALALFTRSLRLDARSARTYWVRAALLGALLVGLLVALANASVVSAAGLQLFQTVIYINFIFVSIAGLSYFASVITEEKEEQTLGLLRMTGLGPLSLIFGKSTSRLMSVIFFVVAQFPLTMLAVALGGVAGDQVLAAYCTLLAYILLVCNLALFFSVVCRRTGSAVFCGCLLLGLLLGAPIIGPPMLKDWIAAGWLKPSSHTATMLVALFQGLNKASAFSRLEAIMESGFADAPMGYQVWSNLAVSALFFLLAWGVFNAFTREFHDAAPARGPIARRTSRWRLFHGGRVWRNALMWKDFHFLTGGVVAMIAKVLVLGATIGAMILWRQPYGKLIGSTAFTMEDMGKIIMATALIVIVLELMLYATCVFSEEVKWKTLTTLALLPRPLRQIAYAKVAGCLLALAPALFFFFVGVVIAPHRLNEALTDVISEPAYWKYPAQVVFFVHLMAYTSVVIRRGAAGLVFSIMCATNFLFSSFVVLLFDDVWASVMITIILLAGTWLLHRSTASQLELAAEQ